MHRHATSLQTTCFRIGIALAAFLVAAQSTSTEPSAERSTQTDGEPSAAQKETARQLMDRGGERLERGDLQGALEAYRGAHEIMGVPTTALALAKVQIELGLLTEAVDALRLATRYPQEEGEPEAFTEAREEAAKLDYQIAARIPALTVVVEGVRADDATVAVDGEALPDDAIELPVRVNPGEHRISAQAEGTLEASHRVVLEEGEERRVVLELERDPSWSPSEPAPAPGDPAPQPREPAEPDTGGWTLPAVGLGVAGAGVIAGAITGGLSWSKASALEDECGASGCLESVHREEHDTIIALANASNASFAVAGAGAIVAVVGLALLEDEPEERAAWTPVVGPLGAGLRGTF